MSRDDNVTDEVEATVGKVPLRTYSRRGRLTKRSYSTLPEDLPDSLVKTNSDDNRLRGSQLGLPERKRRRNTTPSGKTLTELFWEQLSSSAPFRTRASETDQFEQDVPGKLEENAAMREKPTQSVESNDNLLANHVNQTTGSFLGQRTRNVSSELVIPATTRESSVCSEKPDSDEASVSHSKQRKPLNLSSSRGLKTKRARRALDVDESLSVVEAGPVKGALISNVPMAWSKGNDDQGFRKLDSAKDTKVKHSSDGFERNEARASVFWRRRRMDSIDHNIGSLELTQGSAPIKKVEGPTWVRVQKKTQVSTTTKPWSKTQHSDDYTFEIDVEEDMEPVQSRQSNSDDQEPRGIRKRRISQLISVDEGDGEDEEQHDGPTNLTVPGLATQGVGRPSGPDVKKVKTSRARHCQDSLYISDTDEPVVLLASPADPTGNEDEATYISDSDEPVILLVSPGQSEHGAALATIPRTDTPEHGADNEETVGQLPPKEWMLNVLDYDRDALALRPDSREWTREVEIPDTSPNK